MGLPILLLFLFLIKGLTLDGAGDGVKAYIGEWSVDETLNAIYNKTGKGFIVVGIENGGDYRVDEYTPWENEKYGGGKGATYVQGVIEGIKAYIDDTYRTKSSQKNTAMIGSSLGGLISYYAGLKHNDIFGKIGALSPSFWFSDKVVDFTKENGKIDNVKLFLLVGEKEGETMVEDLEKMRKLLIESGFNPSNLQTKIVSDAEHNETFWKSEFEGVINWLFELN